MADSPNYRVSESSADWGRLESRFSRLSLEGSPPAPAAGTVDSSLIRHIGGHLSEVPIGDPDLDPSDLEIHHDSLLESDAVSANVSSQSTVQEQTPRVPDRYRNIPGGAYLSPDQFMGLRPNIHRRVQSSGHSNDGFQTTQASPKSVTTFDGEEEDIGRLDTPYFTPSHTPSHRSLATEDLDEAAHENYIERVPESLSPWSPHHHHQSQIARGAIEAYNFWHDLYPSERFSFRQGVITESRDDEHTIVSSAIPVINSVDRTESKSSLLVTSAQNLDSTGNSLKDAHGATIGFPSSNYQDFDGDTFRHHHIAEDTGTVPTASTSKSRKRQRQFRKGATGGGNDPDDSGDDHDGDGSDDDDRKGKDAGFFDRASSKRLRCPFFMNDPERFGSIQACSSGLGFMDMPKLKQHLKRIHIQSSRCPRCQIELKTQGDLYVHLRTGQVCEKRDKIDDGRLSQQEWQQIESRKPSDYHLKAKEEKWALLYHALFPYRKSAPSPYDKPIMFYHIEDLLVDAFEEEFIRRGSPTLAAVVDEVKSMIPEVLRRSVAEKSILTDVSSLPGLFVVDVNPEICRTKQKVQSFVQPSVETAAIAADNPINVVPWDPMPSSSGYLPTTDVSYDQQWIADSPNAGENAFVDWDEYWNINHFFDC
ncbi:hypothetical protein BDV96DRAFT_669759 [Lophiotrema nucula]|uniref:C2H2-type domain-containing protein n=1 Tax=Lophiotrema nucula TaxID=690887 RepID=A0A6A5YSW3_9PLEO|nr:hypothetical protein BDV96DRAFT_669759 [Lophiotrema nucula]